MVFFQLVSGWEWTQMFPFFFLSPSPPPPDSQIEKELHPKMEIVCVQIPFLKSSFKRFLVCVQPKKKNSSWLGCCCIYFIELQTYFVYFYGGEVLSLWCSQFWELLETICGDFFFLFQKRRKVPMKRERKKANDLRKTLKKGKSGWFQAPKVDTSPMKSHKARHYVQLPLFAPFLCNISRSTSKARSIWGHLPPCNTFTLTCRIKLATRFLFGWNKTVFIIIYPDEE